MELTVNSILSNIICLFLQLTCLLLMSDHCDLLETKSIWDSDKERDTHCLVERILYMEPLDVSISPNCPSFCLISFLMLRILAIHFYLSVESKLLFLSHFLHILLAALYHCLEESLCFVCFFLVVKFIPGFHSTQCSNLWKGFWRAISWTGMKFSHVRINPADLIQCIYDLLCAIVITSTQLPTLCRHLPQHQKLLSLRR